MQSGEGVHCFGVSFHHSGMEDFNAFIINAALNLLDVNGNYLLVSEIQSTWIWYSEDICPFDVMSLLSSLHLKVSTQS
jgi:hypothetical protein